jgi:hypothetical protein
MMANWTFLTNHARSCCASPVTRECACATSRPAWAPPAAARARISGRPSRHLLHAAAPASTKASSRLDTPWAVHWSAMARMSSSDTGISISGSTDISGQASKLYFGAGYAGGNWPRNPATSRPPPTTTSRRHRRHRLQLARHRASVRPPEHPRLHPRSGPGQASRHHVPHPAIPQRPGRGHERRDENNQAADVWPYRIHPLRDRILLS